MDVRKSMFAALRLPTRPALSPKQVYTASLAWLFVVAITCVALQAPGQISMDSSIQLYEAATGHSISWFSPFMSALLAWLGGGLVATSLFVALNVICIYGSFGLLLIALLLRSNQSDKKISPLAAIVTIAAISNPVIFLYAGIIWKDVLFGSEIVVASTLLLLSALFRNRALKYLLCGIAIIAMSSALLTRQQGMIVSPLLVVSLAIAMSSHPSRLRSILKWTLILGTAFFLTAIIESALVTATIRGGGARDTSVGFNDILNYDISGIVYLSSNKARASEPEASIPDDVKVAIVKTYSKYRIDFLMDDPIVGKWFNEMPWSKKLNLWEAMLIAHPRLYAINRIHIFLALLDAYDINKCLPVHVGISGNKQYLKGLNIAGGTSVRAQLLYTAFTHIRGFLFYRHWFYVLLMCGALVILRVSRAEAKLRIILACISIVALVFVATFIPTSIACDYRYLFAIIPLASLVFIALANLRILNMFESGT
jgi:hypothetical protein